MATAQVNGSPTTSTSTNNNHGSMKANGSSNTQLNSNPVSQPPVGVFGSTVVEGLGKTQKSVGGGDFAHSHQRPLGFRLTSELAGAASTALATPQNPSSWINAKHPRNKVRTRQLATAIRNGQLNLFTGAISPPAAVVDDPWYSIAAAGTVTDIADADKTVDDTPASPASLRYVVGGQPTVDQYKASTQW